MIAMQTLAMQSLVSGATSAAGDPSAVLADIGHLAPMMIVAFWALLLLCTDAFASAGLRRFQQRLALAGVGIAMAAGLSLFGDWQYDAGIRVFSGFLVVDQFSLLLDLAILGITGGVILFAGDFARSHRFEYGEQEALLLLATFGIMVLNHSSDLLALFLGIETMSIAVYVLVGARWNSRGASEAALKYFLVGAFTSAILLMGIALIYGAVGSTEYGAINRGVSQIFHEWRAVQGSVASVLDPTRVDARLLPIAQDRAIVGAAPPALFLPGLFLVLSALLFKVSAVPFHMWTPDAYEGAPTPVTAFMAAGVKLGGFAALLKLIVGVFSLNVLVVAPYGWTTAVAVVALLTMTVGNLAAVRQVNVKRMLAYSSVAHVGYLLIGLVAAGNFYGHAVGIRGFRAGDQEMWAQTAGDNAVAALVFYLLTYGIATLGTFACLAFYGANKKEANSVHQWAGMASRHPGLALGMTICLLSLMGMPPLAGFLGKFALFRSALENANTLMLVIVVVAVLNSVVAAYYYLRLIVAMYFRPPPEHAVDVLPSLGARTVVVVAAALTLALGLGADAAMRRVKLATAGFALSPEGSRKAARVDAVRASWELRDLAAQTKAQPQAPPVGAARVAPASTAPKPKPSP